MLERERVCWSLGRLKLAGIDEAGRGPLAGPVVAAAVAMARDTAEPLAKADLLGLTDSKKLTASRREIFFARLTGHPGIQWAVGICEPDEIDRLNILRATHLAMRRAVEGLREPPEHLLIDGLPVPGLPVSSEAIVKGDGSSLLIAAASVIAKVTRDRILVELDARYPGYGLATHKGYGTRAHLEALRTLGPSPCHRRSFAPIRQAELGLS